MWPGATPTTLRRERSPPPARGLNAGNENLDPEKNETWELGTKWELLDQRLSLNAAIFRVDKTNGRVELDDGTYELQGEQRVKASSWVLPARSPTSGRLSPPTPQSSSEVLKAAPGDG